MSLFSATSAQHLTITAPGATGLVQGPYTVATLYRNVANFGVNLWFGYQANNFSKISVFYDGDVYVDFAQWDGNLSISTAVWRWIVASKSSATEAPRVHVADYASSGALTWQHNDTNSARGNWPAIDRFTFGDEFGSGFLGDLACHAAFTTELSDAAIEGLFERSSLDILSMSPQFFTHWPLADGIGAPFVDLAGGGVETIRTGTWSASSDPTGFNFDLGRSGKPKTWNGSSWDKHQAKVWNGSNWDPHPMSGYHDSAFVLSK